MGSGIAMSFANAGIDVRIFDSVPEALERGRATIAASYEAQVARGKLTAPDAAKRVGRITLVRELEALAHVDVAIEAVFEDLDLKRDIFARLGSICLPNALLATNTSTLDVDAIAGAAPRPERTVGMHFFSPAHVMKLLEVVRGSGSSRDTIAAAVALGERIGKIPVVVGNCDGFVGNRMLLGYKREAEFAVLAGATPAQVDAALESFGFAMGPFAVSDLAGIDIGWRAKHERIKRGAAPPFAVSDLPDAMVSAGRLGQKTARGFYRYEPGDRARHADPETDAIVDGERARLGISPRSVDDAEIVERCTYALVLEGARILGDGIASSADDIDAIWVNGYGFPKARGGPMRFAEDTGIPHVLSRIRAFKASDPAFWRVSPVLERAASEGRFRQGRN
jgi:3-hydroxyacyl-CoA dehydrogenase